MKAPHQMRPGNRYAREGGIARTLGQLVAAKMALVAVCRRCKHRRLLYPAKPALQRLPGTGGQPARILALAVRLNISWLAWDQ